jgi:hypothetical protein
MQQVDGEGPSNCRKPARLRKIYLGNQDSTRPVRSSKGEAGDVATTALMTVAKAPASALKLSRSPSSTSWRER